MRSSDGPPRLAMAGAQVLGAVYLGNATGSLKMLNVFTKEPLSATGQYHLLFLGLLDRAI